MSRTGATKMYIDVFPALLSTLKRIRDVLRNDVINYLNNKSLFNGPKKSKNHAIFSSTKYSILLNSQSSSKKTELKKLRDMILEPGTV